MSTKNSLKDKLEDGELDLSMMQLTDVPVRVSVMSYCHILCVKSYIAGDRAAW